MYALMHARTHTHTHTHTHTFHRDVSSILHTRQPVTEVPVSECVGGEGVEGVRGVEDVMEVDGVNPAHKPEIISLVSMTLEFVILYCMHCDRKLMYLYFTKLRHIEHYITHANTCAHTHTHTHRMTLQLN